MSAFQPDGLFLKRSGNGYKGKVLQYNSAAVVDAHVEHGYLVQSSIEDDLSRLGVQRLKEALKGKGLPTSGNKGALVDRILAEFAESEISALPLEPRLLLTELGEAAVEQYETAAQKKRIEQALHLADLISSQAFAAAAAEIRPAEATIAGSDVLPEAIFRYFADVGSTDKGFIAAVVESAIMGHYPRVVIPDMASIGVEIDEDKLNSACLGCASYASALRADRHGSKYKVCACPCCQHMDGKTFSLADAKVGVTLPPFSLECRALVVAD